MATFQDFEDFCIVDGEYRYFWSEIDVQNFKAEGLDCIDDIKYWCYGKRLDNIQKEDWHLPFVQRLHRDFPFELDEDYDMSDGYENDWEAQAIVICGMAPKPTTPREDKPPEDDEADTESDNDEPSNHVAEPKTPSRKRNRYPLAAKRRRRRARVAAI